MNAARRLGLGVSLDLNYRSALWDRAEAGQVIGDQLAGVDVLLGSGSDAASLFGFEPPQPWGPGVVKSHARLAERLRDRFGLRAVAGTVRVAAPDRAMALHGLLVDDDGEQVSAWHQILDATGRIGTGDAFAAGVLRGVLLGHPAEETVEFAAAAAHLKQSIRGDVNVVTVDEVEAVVAGAATDQVRR